MKQTLLYISLILLFSCKLEENNSKVNESYKEILNELEKQRESFSQIKRKGDSLIALMETAIENNKFIPDIIITNEKYSSNPFKLQTPIVKNLFKSQYTSVDTLLFNNRHVDNQVDTMFIFKYGSSFIEIYKNSSEEFIQSGFSNSDFLNLKHGLTFGMSKSEFITLLSNIDSISNSHNNFRIHNTETTQNVNIKFVKNKLEYIHYEGYLD